MNTENNFSAVLFPLLVYITISTVIYYINTLINNINVLQTIGHHLYHDVTYKPRIRPQYFLLEIKVFFNSGLMSGGQTVDGVGMIFGVNHLGHFLLTLLLLERLKEGGPSRVVTVASKGYEFGRIDFSCIDNHKDLGLGDSDWNLFEKYCHSKLCNVLFTHELATRLQGSNVTCYSLHPG